MVDGGLIQSGPVVTGWSGIRNVDVAFFFLSSFFSVSSFDRTGLGLGNLEPGFGTGTLDRERMSNVWASEVWRLVCTAHLAWY